MNKPLRILLVLGLVIAAMLAMLLPARNSRYRKQLASYQAELRAKGEKLSLAELGYPRPPQTNLFLLRLTNLVARIPPSAFEPGLLDLMRMVEPGRAQPAWTMPAPAWNSYGVANARALAWEDVEAALLAVEAPMRELRQLLSGPLPAYHNAGATNFFSVFFSGSSYNFVAVRKASQWLMGDAIGALHARDRKRAGEDLRALLHLLEANRDEPTLVNQMIRVAIGGLAVSTTWEALQTDGWTEPELAALKRDWESVDFTEALEQGFIGERAFNGYVCDLIRRDAAQAQRLFRMPSSPSPRLLDSLSETGTSFLWRLTLEENQLRALEFHQAYLGAIRRLRQDTPWPEVRPDLASIIATVDSRIFGPGRYRYALFATMVPNFVRAATTVVHHETERRLVVTAIAIQRYQLGHGHPPPDLQSLTPDYLAAVPLDPMTGKALGYRLDNEKQFILYSAGEDGEDNQGDATSATPRAQADVWAGRDAVWPAAVRAPDSPKPGS